MSSLYAVILAGGSGTRFWPLSRQEYPKQLLKIIGKDSLLEGTIARVGNIIPPENVFIVTTTAQVDAMRNINIAGANVIVEPASRNTAPAIAIAAVRLLSLNPDSIMLVLPADHFIRDQKAFEEALRASADIARDGYLVTLGIKPSRPETGYGYIKAGFKVQGSKDGLDAYTVERFVEKPDTETARRYVDDGNYFWNSGIFCFRAMDIIDEIKNYQPEVYSAIVEASSFEHSNVSPLTAHVYEKLPSISIDYAVMERTERAVVIPVDMGWSDVGSWSALDEVMEKDDAGNILRGNVIELDCRNSTIVGNERVIATIGLEGVIVADTPDAVLICPKDRCQDVKMIVDRLKERNAEECIIHRTVERPWGSYTVLESGERYKIKRVMLKSGAKLSLQMHHHRSEHWIVVSGTARVTVGEKTYSVHPNESTYVPVSTKHRLENPGKIPLQIIEIQNGDYLGEDDIVRFDDEYGRCKSS